VCRSGHPPEPASARSPSHRQGPERIGHHVAPAPQVLPSFKRISSSTAMATWQPPPSAGVSAVPDRRASALAIGEIVPASQRKEGSVIGRGLHGDGQAKKTGAPARLSKWCIGSGFRTCLPLRSRSVLRTGELGSWMGGVIAAFAGRGIEATMERAFVDLLGENTILGAYIRCHHGEDPVDLEIFRCGLELVRN